MTAVVNGIASLNYVQPQVRVLRISYPSRRTPEASRQRPASMSPRSSNPRICDSTFVYMEDDVIFNAFVNYSLAELDDPERFWKCWRLNDCGTCLNRGDGCGWCPYVRTESSIHYKFDDSSDFRIVGSQWKHAFVFFDSRLSAPNIISHRVRSKSHLIIL